MAKYDAVRIKGKMYLTLSNDHSVGAGSRNEISDVMLIQAMLRYIVPYQLMIAEPAPSYPAVTGVFDAETGEAINHFQSSFSPRLLNLDGVVHPPSYEGRDLKEPLLKPLMTITMLHIICKHSTKFYAHSRYPLDITRLMPQLLPFLKHRGMTKLSFLA
jgi:hypothetical protein